MTNKKPYLVNLKGKGLDGTGVTEAIARQMCNGKGRHYIAIVEVVVDVVHDRLSGQMVADLAVNQFWPATSEDLDEHLRNITLVLHQNAGLTDGDTPLDFDGPAPTVKQVLADGARFEPHDYMSSGLSENDNAICDRCGNARLTKLHPAELNDDETDPYDYVHAKRGEITVCGLNSTVGKSLRRHEDVDQVTCPECRGEDVAADDPDGVGTADHPVIVDVAEIGTPGWIDRLGGLNHVHDSNGRCLKHQDGQICLFREDDPEPADPDDPAYEPHAFTGDPAYVCGICDQAADSAIHTKVLEPAVTT